MRVKTGLARPTCDFLLAPAVLNSSDVMAWPDKICSILVRPIVKKVKKTPKRITMRSEQGTMPHAHRSARSWAAVKQNNDRWTSNETGYGALALTSACNAEHARVLIVEGTAIKPAAPAADGNLSTGGSGWVLRSGDVG